MECRVGCGACCIAPSISSPIPGLPGGKPAGTRCIHLDEGRLCRLFGDPSRPAVCAAFPANPDSCGDSRKEAIARLQWLEEATR